MREVRRILYVRTDRLGDVLMNLPALRVLRQNFPKAWLTLLVDKPLGELFRGQEDLDEVMEVDAAELAGSARARREFARKVRAIRYDMVVVSNPGKFFHWLAFSSGASLRVGWRRKWPFFLNRTLPDLKHEAGRHEMDSNLALVARVCEKKWDGILRLGRTPEAVKKMKEWLDAHCSERAVIAVHVGTSHPQKRWPVERFVELCRRLQKDRQEALVFIGGGEEREATRQVLEKLERPAFDLCGRTTLAELAAFFADRRVRTLVSSDSGPVHVAWISGKPVVAFYALDLAGSDPARWGPRDMRSRVIHKPMKDISVDETLAALEQVLA